MHQELIKYCKKKKITFLSTPYDEDSADVLDELYPAFKIASTDNDNYPLLAHIAKRSPDTSTACRQWKKFLKLKSDSKKWL